MTETGRVERVARRAIARAKRRGAAEVSADDLLLGALGEISRFGVAWIGDRAVDVEALGNGAGAADGATGNAAPVPGPAYSPAVVDLLDRAAEVARADGSPSMAIVHLLVAFGEVECGLMAELRRRHGFDDVAWRAALARGEVGFPPALAGDGTTAGGGERRPGAAGPELLSVDQAADYLGVHAQTIRNYIRAGKLPAYRLAGERYIRLLRKDLLSLLERVPTDEESEENT